MPWFTVHFLVLVSIGKREMEPPVGITLPSDPTVCQSSNIDVFCALHLAPTRSNDNTRKITSIMPDARVIRCYIVPCMESHQRIMRMHSLYRSLAHDVTRSLRDASYLTIFSRASNETLITSLRFASWPSVIPIGVPIGSSCSLGQDSLSLFLVCKLIYGSVCMYALYRKVSTRTSERIAATWKEMHDFWRFLMQLLL